MPAGDPGAGRREWLRVQAYLRGHRYELGKAAAADYAETARILGTPLLAAPAWRPGIPIRLGAVDLELHTGAKFRGVTGREDIPTPARPIRSDGERYPSFSAALVDLGPPRPLENRPTYRFVDGDLLGARGHLLFGRGRYFDGLDVGEACAHEYAAAVLGFDAGGGLRTLVGDPCDPGRRPVNLAVSTLTLPADRDAGEATFLVHWRDPAKVGHAGGLFQVLPVGIFQPSGDLRWNERTDFDLWRCMLREFAEELLGKPEEYGSKQAPIDYAGWPFAARMTRALRDGSVRAFCLGMGVDPLTFATDLLTVVVIDAPVFDELFRGLVDTNAEGTLVRSPSSSRAPGGAPAPGIPFIAEEVERFVHAEPMQAAGVALLALAWRYRDSLLA